MRRRREKIAIWYPDADTWSAKCPVCGAVFDALHRSNADMRRYIKHTLDCPSCDTVLQVQEDLSVTEYIYQADAAVPGYLDVIGE